jgi:hypothetical protein
LEFRLRLLCQLARSLRVRKNARVARVPLSRSAFVSFFLAIVTSQKAFNVGQRDGDVAHVEE